jgi:hypothetical protein
MPTRSATSSPAPVPWRGFTSYQIGKVLTRSFGAVANALDKLVSLGIAELATTSRRHSPAER